YRRRAGAGRAPPRRRAMIGLDSALQERYTAALHNYLAGAGEAALQEAYELGRAALDAGQGLLDLAVLHQRALAAAIPEDRAAETARTLVARAAEFLAESLSPFEITHRGFQESNARLRDLLGAIERERAILAAVTGAMSDGIVVFDAQGRLA